MLDVRLFKTIIVKILYSDSWILSRIHYSRAICLSILIGCPNPLFISIKEKSIFFFKLGMVGFVLVWLYLPSQVYAVSKTTSSCVTCHTHYGKMKKNLSKDSMKVSPLIEGMG